MKCIDIKLEDIKLIESLWEHNRAYHEVSSEYFGIEYKTIRFEDQMAKFRNFDEDMYKISVCKEKDAIIGYCISTVIDDIGEVASLHVDKSKRRNGIGELLVSNHLEWMRARKCMKIGLTVSQENVSAIGFYKKLGFFPNTLYMQQQMKALQVERSTDAN